MTLQYLEEEIVKLKEELLNYSKEDIKKIIKQYDGSHYETHDCPLWYECTQQERSK